MVVRWLVMLLSLLLILNYKQDEKLIKFVLNDPGRVSYRELTPGDDEMMKIVNMAVKAKIISKPIPVAQFLDRQFVPKDIKEATVDMADAGKYPAN